MKYSDMVRELVCIDLRVLEGKPTSYILNMDAFFEKLCLVLASSFSASKMSSQSSLSSDRLNDSETAFLAT